MEVLPAGQKMARLHMGGSVATQTADGFILVSTTLALYDSCLWIEPMVTNIAIGHLPTSLLTALPTLLRCIVLAYDSGHPSR